MINSNTIIILAVCILQFISKFNFLNNYILILELSLSYIYYQNRSQIPLYSSIIYGLFTTFLTIYIIRRYRLNLRISKFSPETIKIFNLVDSDNVEEFKLLCSKKTIKELEEMTYITGQTILNYAVSSSSHKIIEYLLDIGFNINLKSQSGEMALYRATYCEDLETVKILLKYKPDLELKSPIVYYNTLNNYIYLQLKFRTNAIETAVFRNHLGLVKEFLKHGAYFSVKNYKSNLTTNWNDVSVEIKREILRDRGKILFTIYYKSIYVCI